MSLSQFYYCVFGQPVIPTNEGMPPTIDVSCIDATVARVIAHGGMLLIPKTAIRESGFLAYCQDIEGNVFSILQIVS